MTCQINIVRFHRPAQQLLGSDRKIGGGDHVCQPKCFDRVGYCGDFQGRWRFGHPLEHDAAKRGVALQLLTHPICSHENRSQPPVARLCALATDKASCLRDALGANCKPYAEAMASENAQS
jgi:hypothetical protein